MHAAWLEPSGPRTPRPAMSGNVRRCYSIRPAATIAGANAHFSMPDLRHERLAPAMTELPETPQTFATATWEEVAAYYEALATAPLDRAGLDAWLARWSTLEELLG